MDVPALYLSKGRSASFIVPFVAQMLGIDLEREFPLFNKTRGQDFGRRDGNFRSGPAIPQPVL